MVNVPYRPTTTVPPTNTGTGVPSPSSGPALMKVTVRGSPSGSKAVAVASPVGSTPAVPLAMPPASVATDTTFCATGGSLTPRTVINSWARSVRPSVSTSR
ncbi:hypothetical protein D3C76_1090560 [compost metagenome]